MTWWQVLIVVLVSLWVGVTWVEHVVEEIVARRLAAHLINIERLLQEKGVTCRYDPPWPEQSDSEDP